MSTLRRPRPPHLLRALAAALLASAAAAAPAGSAAAAGATVPTLRTSPGSGSVHRTFTLRVPHSALGGVRSAARLRIGIQFAPRKANTKVSRNCTVARLPKARMAGSGSSVRAIFTLAPRALMTRHKGTWCTGTYSLDVYAQAVSGTASVIRDLAHARFVVKPRR